MIEINDKKDCCGCWACENVCPKKCIKMTEDEEGFFYPVVDTDLCVECHLCETVCPVINVKADTPKPQRAFLLQHKDQQVLQESASGGAFTAIASYVLDKGGVVFGAAYDKDFLVIHDYVEKIEDLRKFRNSKYVQSHVGNAYKKAKEFLRAGRLVCFSGTPCQLEGLLRYVKKQYENLITVDVMCHSITSPKIFKMYVDMKQQEFGGKIDNIMFRDKNPYGYKYSSMSIYKGGKQVYKEGVETDVLLRSFFSNVNVRPSCYDCKFKKRYHVTDFTIWDCFDVYRFSKELDNDKGVTRMLAHTDKACNILQEITEKVHLVEIPSDMAVAGVKEMLHSVPMNPKRYQFFKESNNGQRNNVLIHFFPLSFKAILEKRIRVLCCRLGVYSYIKRLAKTMVKELKRS